MTNTTSEAEKITLAKKLPSKGYVFDETNTCLGELKKVINTTSEAGKQTKFAVLDKEGNVSYQMRVVVGRGVQIVSGGTRTVGYVDSKYKMYDLNGRYLGFIQPAHNKVLLVALLVLLFLLASCAGIGGIMNQFIQNAGAKPDSIITFDKNSNVTGLDSLGQNVSWNQQTEISFFQNRYQGPNEKRPTVLAPGDFGYYIFEVSNTNDFAILYSITITEKQVAVPIEYRLCDSANAGLTEWLPLSDSTLVLEDVVIESNSQTKFVIEWRWNFEGNDAIDSLLGEADDSTYEISLSFNLREREIG